MTVVLVLAICAAVLLALVLPFHRGRHEPPSEHKPGFEPVTDPPREGAGPARVEPASVVAPSPSMPPSSPSGASLGAPTTPHLDDLATRTLRDEKDRLLQAIAELRFDFEAGKLSREDFDSENATLRGRAAAIIRELDRKPA